MVNKKLIKTQENMAGGFDLLVERDAGNPVLILTGSVKYSLDFWKRLRDICNWVIPELEDRIEEDKRTGQYG